MDAEKLLIMKCSRVDAPPQFTCKSNSRTDIDIVLKLLQAITIFSVIAVIFFKNIPTYLCSTILDYESALYFESIDICPANAQLHFLIGKTLFFDKNVTGALSHFDHARDIDPNLCAIDYFYAS